MPSPRGLAILGLLGLMELLAGFALVVGSSLLDATSLSYAMFWLLILEGVLGGLAALAITTAGLRARWSRVAMLAGGALAAGIPALLTSTTTVSFLVAALLLALAYWRGLAVFEEPPTHEEVQRRFGYGFGILFLGIITVIARGIIYESSVWHMLAFLGIAYTLTALVALGLSRVEGIREPGAGQAVFFAVAVQLAFLLLLGLLAVQLFAADLAGALANLVHPLLKGIADGLTAALGVLLTPLGWIVEHLRAQAHHPSHVQAPSAPQSATPRRKKLKAHPADNTWIAVGGLVFMLVLLAGVAYLIWRTLPRLPHQRREAGYREQRESLWSFTSFWQAFLLWVRAVLRRGTGRVEQAIRESRQRVFGPQYPADPIRELYARALRRARRSGLSRPPATTPTEFATRIRGHWTDVAADFAVLTEAYVQRRYGDISFGEAEIATVRQHWRRSLSGMRRVAEPEASKEDAAPTGAAPIPAPPSNELMDRRPGSIWQRAVQQLDAIRGDPLVRGVSSDLVSATLAVVILLAFIIGLVAYLALAR